MLWTSLSKFSKKKSGEILWRRFMRCTWPHRNGKLCAMFNKHIKIYSYYKNHMLRYFVSTYDSVKQENMVAFSFFLYFFFWEILTRKELSRWLVGVALTRWSDNNQLTLKQKQSCQMIFLKYDIKQFPGMSTISPWCIFFKFRFPKIKK